MNVTCFSINCLCFQKALHVWEQLASILLHKNLRPIVFCSAFTALLVYHLLIFSSLRINTVPEKSPWCTFLVISQTFLKVSCNLFFFFPETNFSHLFPVKDSYHSYSSHEICLVYSRHILVPDTAFFKSSHCLFNVIANNSCNAWNKILASFRLIIQCLKFRVRFLIPKSVSRES